MNNPAQGMTQQQLINSANQQIGMNNPAQGMTQQQITQHANNMYNQQYVQYANHIAYGQLQQQNQIYSGRSQLWPQEDWVFNGRAYNITDFAEVVYGDTPERTAFLLKYTKEK